MITNALPDFWALYCYTENFLNELPPDNNTLDIYDKIYREQEEEKLAEFYGYRDDDIDDLNNLDYLDEYDLYHQNMEEEHNTGEDRDRESSDESDYDDFNAV